MENEIIQLIEEIEDKIFLLKETHQNRLSDLEFLIYKIKKMQQDEVDKRLNNLNDTHNNKEI